MACKKCGGKGCSSCQKSRAGSAKPSSNRVSALKHSESLSRSGSSGKTSSSGSSPLILSLRDSPKTKESSSSSKPSSSKLKESPKAKESSSRASSRKPKESSSKHSISKQISSSHKTESSSRPSSSSAFKTAYKSNHDRKMASRQIKIESLSKEERKKQEDWAQEKLNSEGLTPCPAGLNWTREKGGYRCVGTNHFVSDGHLAEGKGAYYTRSIIYSPILGKDLHPASYGSSFATPGRDEKEVSINGIKHVGPHYPTPDEIENRENYMKKWDQMRNSLNAVRASRQAGGGGEGGLGFGGHGFGGNGLGNSKLGGSGLGGNGFGFGNGGFGGGGSGL